MSASVTDEVQDVSVDEVVDGELAARLADLATISLAEVTESTGLLTRIDRKYLVPAGLVPAMVAELPLDTTVLEIDGARSFTYESVYFDSPELESYLSAARGRRSRFKVRTRTYVDSGGCMLEVKTRGGRGETVKERLPYDLDRRDEITPEGASFAEMLTGRTSIGDRLDPTLVTRYRRATLVAGSSDWRLTIDTDLECTTRSSTHPGCSCPEGRVARVPGYVIVETKSMALATPADRWLWSQRVRPKSISKFGTGYAALHPEAPSNKWHRVIGRFFEVEHPAEAAVGHN